MNISVGEHSNFEQPTGHVCCSRAAMDPRIALLAACIVTVYSYYAVWAFLNGEDEESDTDWHYFFLGLGLSVIVWSLVIGVPTLLAVLWSALLPGYRLRWACTHMQQLADTLTHAMPCA